jgi:hypothetical protein
MKNYLLGLAALSICAPVAAQSQQDGPLVITPQREPDDVQYLPANTEVVVTLNDTLTTKGKAFEEGDTFGLTVQYPVFLDDVVVIPKGARATGRITFLTSKGAFGKSGKMDIEIEYVEVNGRRIPLEGQFRQEGEGNTVATVGGVIAAGVFAGFITGKSAVIPRGRELTVRTREDVPVRIARRDPPPAAPASAPAGQMASASPAPAPRAPASSEEWGLVPANGN